MVILHGANPFLTLKHTVDGRIDIHTLVILHFRCLETLLKLFVLLRIYFGKVRLVNVKLLIDTEDGRGIQSLAFLTGHGIECFLVDTLAVLILIEQVPEDDRHGLRTLVDTESHVLCLQEGHVEWHLVAMHGRVELEEEGITPIQSTADNILRQTIAAIAVDPALLPVAFLHFLHTGNHHFGKLLYRKLRLRLAVTCVMIILPVLHSLLLCCHQFHGLCISHLYIQFCVSLGRLFGMILAPLLVIISIIAFQEKVKPANLTILLHLHQFVVIHILFHLDSY